MNDGSFRCNGVMKWFLAVVFLTIGWDAAAASRVFLLAGQSNMNGLGVAAELEAPYNKPPAGVKIWNKGGWQDLGPGIHTQSTMFGPEIAFGHAIRKAYPDDDIYLIKYAAGGTALYNDWSPEDGPQYKQFMAVTRVALKNLRKAKIDVSIDGMMWMQGESDAFEGKGEAYEANLTAFIQHMREVLKAKKLPFVLARIRTHYDNPPGNNAMVRKAQVKVAESMKSVAWFDTDKYDMRDPGHYNTQGQIDLGKGFASHYSALVKAGSSDGGPDKD